MQVSHLKILTIFNLKPGTKLQVVKSHLPGGLQDDINTTLRRVLRYTHRVAQDGFWSAHSEIQGRHGTSKEPPCGDGNPYIKFLRFGWDIS